MLYSKYNMYNLMNKWVSMRMSPTCTISQWVNNCQRVFKLLKSAGHVMPDWDLDHKIKNHCLDIYTPKDVISKEYCNTLDKWIKYANSIYQTRVCQKSRADK